MNVDQFRRAVISASLLGTALVVPGCAALNYQKPYSSYDSNFSVDDPLPPSAAAQKTAELPPEDAPEVTAADEGPPKPDFSTKFLPEN